MNTTPFAFAAAGSEKARQRSESYLDMLERNPTAELPLFDAPPPEFVPIASPHQTQLEAYQRVLGKISLRQYQVLEVLRRHRADGCTTSEITRELGLGERVHLVSGRITELKGEVRDSRGRNPVVFAGRRGSESVWKVNGGMF